MQTSTPPFGDIPRVVLLGIGGLSLDVLERFAQQGIMPNAARLLASMARSSLQQPFFTGPNASWSTLETGVAPDRHGVVDEWFLDHPRRRLIKTALQIPSPKCTPTDRRNIPAGEFCTISDSSFPAIWHRKPTNQQELECGLARTTDILQSFFAEVRSKLDSPNWRLMLLKLTVLDSLFLRLWHLLGIDDGPGGRRTWIAQTKAVFRTLDERLAELAELAAQHHATFLLLSPYGFVPFRGKIVLNELLRRKGLLYPAESYTRWRYETSRFFERQKRRLGFGNRGEQPLEGLLPVDWRRSRAVGLHGENAAFVYLNTPGRFGGLEKKTPRECEETVAEVLAALTDARHPLSGERLFQEAFSTVERFGIDPVERRWPDIVGIPAAGFMIRCRFDRARQLVRPDPSVSAARTGDGFLCRQTSGGSAGVPGALDLSEALGIIG